MQTNDDFTIKYEPNEFYNRDVVYSYNNIELTGKWEVDVLNEVSTMFFEIEADVTTSYLKKSYTDDYVDRKYFFGLFSKRVYVGRIEHHDWEHETERCKKLVPEESLNVFIHYSNECEEVE